MRYTLNIYLILQLAQVFHNCYLIYPIYRICFQWEVDDDGHKHNHLDHVLVLSIVGGGGKHKIMSIDKRKKSNTLTTPVPNSISTS